MCLLMCIIVKVCPLIKCSARCRKMRKISGKITIYCKKSYIIRALCFLCSGAGWSAVDPVCASDLQARVAEGEFWLDETEFLSKFDDVTVGYPISDEGHLKSIYTGNSLIQDICRN